MVTLAIVLALISCACGVYRLALGVRPHQQWGWPEMWRLACLIAGLRLAALWLGVAGLARPDWLQAVAYFVLMLDLPELYLARGARHDPHRWAILGSLILGATGFIWAAAFVWLRNRLAVRRLPE